MSSPSPSSRPSRISAWTFLKVGLAAVTAYNFGWIVRQHAKLLNVTVSYDAQMISPEQFDKPPPSLLSLNNNNMTSSLINDASFKEGSGSSSLLLYYAHPNDPRGKSLPRHPSPNYELQQLVSSHNQYNCSDGLMYVQDHILSDEITHYDTDEKGNKIPRKIPRLLHFTSKSRCMTPAFVYNIDKWKRVLGSKYSIYIHDDTAIDKFIYHRRWMEFPEIQEVMACVTAGAAKADIWRYLIIWEYGGIYSDMDSAPNKFGIDTITTSDDAWFPLEALGIPAQYWFAASPRHPIMYFSAKHALRFLAWRPNIAENNPAQTTGPGAFKTGLIYFQRLVGVPSSGYIEAGLYHGYQNRSVKVVGTKQKPTEWILREGIRGNKKGNYEKMGMTHFHQTKQKFQAMKGGKVTCLMQRYRMHTDSSVSWDNIV